MIINHTHRFIFLHVPKSAGSSVTHLLSSLTTYRDQEIGSTVHAAAVQAYYAGRFGLRKHSNAASVREVVGPEVWDGYFKFGFVRNPFTRLVSAFHFLKAWDGTPEKYRVLLDNFATVDLFLESDLWVDMPGPDNLFMPQSLWLSLPAGSTELAVDFVGRTERMAEDLATLRDRLGLPADDAPPPRRNVTKAYDGPSGWPASVVERLVARYDSDFTLFGYDRQPPL